MAHFSRTLCAAASMTALLAALGCSEGAKVARPFEVAPVSGLVIYKGVPVEGASVTFHPVEAGKPSARAKTDAQGRFRVWTFDLDDGAVPGEHRVSISKVEIAPLDVDPDAPGYNMATAPSESPPKYLVPQKYESQKTSGLKATVSATGPNEVEFALAG